MTNTYSFQLQYQPYEQPDFRAINQAHELIAETGRVNYLLPGCVGIDKVYADATEIPLPSSSDKPATRHGNGYAGTSKTYRQPGGPEGYTVWDEPAEDVPTTFAPAAMPMTEQEQRAAVLQGKPYANGFQTAPSPSERAMADRVLRWDSKYRKSN